MPRTFNGSTDSIGYVGGFVSGPGIAWSYALWLKATAGANNAKDFYSEGFNNTTLEFLQWQILLGNTARAAFRADAGGSSDLLAGSAAVADGTWHHVCLIQGTDNVITQFVDGVSDGTLTRTGNSNGTTTFDRAGFGFFVANGSNPCACSVAHAAGWNRKLAVQEVKALANGLLPSHLGPVHFFPLWGVDSPEPDIGTATHPSAVMVGTTQPAAGPPVGLSLLRLAS